MMELINRGGSVFRTCLTAVMFLFVVQVGFGQYGPMGFGNADGSDSPAGASQPRLLLWLDGSTVTVSNGQNVTTWPDKSGNGHDFIADAAWAPIFRSTGGPAGRAYVEFSSANNRMYCENFPMSNEGYSIYFVVRSNDSRYGVFSYGVASDPQQFMVVNDNGVSVTIGSSTQNTVINDVDDGPWAYGGIIHDIGSFFWNYRKVGESESNTSFANSETIDPVGTAVIGNIQQTLNGGFLPDDALDGDIAEIIVWEGALNRAQSRLMRTYLWTKYGEPFRRTGNNGWDKFRGYATGSGGKYAEPIGIGRDNGNPNGGEQFESRLKGLVLRVNAGQWTQSRTYLCAGHLGETNAIVNTDLPSGVSARWSRTWEINGADNTNQQFRVGFDFGEGIGGQIPQVVENFVLLRRNGISGTFSITPDSEIIDKAIVDDEVVFTINRSNLNTNNRYYTIGTTNASVSTLDGSSLRTWYAFESGNWNDPLTWTLDGSASPAYVNPNAAIPGVNDAVVIGSGRTVTCDVNNRQQTSLAVFGTLDLVSTSGHNMGAISGNGIIRCAGASGVGNFPSGNTTAFANPTTGGLTEFYGSGFTQNQSLELNRVRINLNNTTSTIIWAANLTHHGLLEINQGTFQVNNNTGTQRSLESFDDVLVESNGRIRVSTTNATHSWTFHKDFLNEGGDVRFTNRTAPVYNTTDPQRIHARFVSDIENQRLVANGTTYLSRLVVNKGSNDTYVLTVSADGPNKFGLYGSCNAGDNTSAFNNETSGPQQNALALVNGTIEIRENVFIPLHFGGGNYNINETATLWVNGGSAGKGPVLLPGAATSTAIVPYGKILVTAGLLRADCGSGITTRANGLIQVDGGEVFATQIRTSVFGPANVGGIIINGGLVDVDGTRSGNPAGGFYTFSLTYTGNLFRMTGGILRVAGPTTAGLLFINSDPDQTSVSGGTVIADVVNTSANHRITSRAPFWNLEIQRSNGSTTISPVVIRGGSSDGVSVPDLPLRVDNSLNINGQNTPILQMGPSSTAALDAFIRGNFTVENGGTYQHFGNTTHFVGGSNSLLNLPSLTTQTFHHVVVDKSDQSRFARIQTGNTALAMEVQGDFRVERGYFDNSNRHVRILGNIVNRQAFGVEASTGVVRMEGASAQEIFSDNGIFHNLTINNTNGITLTNGDLRVRKTIELEDNCHFFLQNFKLRIESVTGNVTVPNPGNNPNSCFVTDGTSGAGGVELIFRAPTQFDWFNLGVEEGGSVKYTPAFVRINGNYADDGFIQIVPVNESLPLIDTVGVPDYLNFYWKVSHSEFDQIPNVSHMFVYDDADVEGSAANFVSGRVLFDAPFDRQFDELTAPATSHVNTGTRRIFYNNTDVAQNNSGVGIPITNASYTAGHEDLFDGRPGIYYSRSTNLDANFNDPANWNELGQFNSGDDVFDYHGTGVSGNTGYPQAGSIAFIGFDPVSGKPHSYEAPAAGVTASEVRFTPMQNAAGDRLPRWNGPNPADITVLRPTFSFASTAEIEHISSISGEGTILMRDDVDLSVVDLGNFLVEDSSIVMVEVPTTSTLSLNFLPAEMPNLFITSASNGSIGGAADPRRNVKVRGDLEIAGNAKVLLNSGASGDLDVGRDLILATYQAITSGPQLRFRNNGTPRTAVVARDIRLIGDNASIDILSPSTTPQLIHSLEVGGNIIQNAPTGTGLNLFTAQNQDYITLTLFGEGNHQFTNTAGNIPNLGKIILNKGTNINSGFSFNSQINVSAPANEAVKPIELINGLLTIDNSTTNITLSNGGGNFTIPSTAGLALGSGNLFINGNQIGLSLAGLLKIDGGTFEIGNTGGDNNYIQYAGAGSPKIEVNGGELLVGSQVRRNLTNTQGALDYRQSGGLVRLGIYDAPNANRGVLEITNSGSRFDFTGGDLIFVRGVNSTNVASLLLQPTQSAIDPSATIVVEDASSPSGAAIKNFGIQSIVALPALSINNDSNEGPVVKLYGNALEINNSLDIASGALFDAQIYDLTVFGDISNDGTLLSAAKLTLNHSSVQTVGGSGVFTLYDLERNGGGVTLVDADLTVNRDFTMDEGIMNFGIHALEVKGNVSHDGDLSFTTGQGLIMNGVGSQLLRRSNPGLSHIDIFTTNNSAGINQIASAGHNFEIGENLRMRSGVLNLNGNLMILGVDAGIEQLNPFGENNMISTGGAFTNFGVRKELAADFTEDVFLPLGLDKYMPVLFDFSDIGFSSGNAPSSYLVRLVQPAQNSVLDPNNVLQMYFSVDVEGIGTGLRMDMELLYDQDYVAVTGANTEEEYIGVRVVNGSPQADVFKFGTSVVNTVDNLIKFSFDGVNSEGIRGDYFAGIDAAIPDFVPVYTTVKDGVVTNSTGENRVYDLEVSGGGAPNGAIVIVDEGDVLTMNINGVTFYKTIINSGAILEIDETSQHRLGIVEGTGTIRLINSGSLPNGNYNDFLTCTGGNLEFAGTADVEILANLPLVRSVAATGSGLRTVANNNVTICENLTVDGPAFSFANITDMTIEADLELLSGSFNAQQADVDVLGNAILNGGSFTAGNIGRRTFHNDVQITAGAFNVGSGGRTEIKGNLTNQGGSFDGGAASASLVFNGTIEQIIEGDFITPNNFRIAEIDNPAGIRLHNDVDVDHTFRFTDGLAYTGEDSLIHYTHVAVVSDPVGGKPTSFVHGPMNWTMNTTGDRIFPVGKGNRSRPLRLANRSAARTWTVEYYDTLATVRPEVANLELEDPILIETISIQEFWRVNSNVGGVTTSRVGLSWGENSAVAEDPGDYDKLVVMEYDNTGPFWVSRGANSASFDFDGLTNTGHFTSATASSFSEKFFTLGSSDAINPLPVTFLHFDGATDGETHTLSWATASETNNDYFELERSSDGRHFVAIARIDGAGNSTARQDYHYVDSQAPTGRVYYRLRQVDFNGDFDYADEIVTLVRDKAAESKLDFLLYPNPTSYGYVRVQAAELAGEFVQVAISDLSGRVVSQRLIWIDDSGISEEINLNVGTGMYVVSLFFDSVFKSKPLIVTK